PVVVGVGPVGALRGMGVPGFVPGAEVPGALVPGNDPVADALRSLVPGSPNAPTSRTRNRSIYRDFHPPCSPRPSKPDKKSRRGGDQRHPPRRSVGLFL